MPAGLADKATVDLWPTTGQILGLSKNATYQAAERGEIPTLRMGRRWLVPVAPLLRMLGLGSRHEEQPDAAAQPAQ